MENFRMEVDDIVLQCEKVTIGDEPEEEVIEVEVGCLSSDIIDLRWALVGRLLIERSEKIDFMKRVLAEAWKPGMGVCFSEIESSRFLIQFGHEADVRRVLEGGPWSFNNNVLLIERVFPGEDPKHKPISHISLWLQAHDIPVGCMSESVAQLLGRAAGEVIEVDPNNFNGYKRSFMRLKVKLDVSKPLKQSVALKLRGKTTRIMFRYERLPTYG